MIFNQERFEAMTGDEAKTALSSIGWFNDDICLLTVRFCDQQWSVFQEAHMQAMCRPDAPTVEEFIVELAKEYLAKSDEKEKATSGIAVPDAAMV